MKSEMGSLSMEGSKPQRRHIPSASSALVIGAILGLLQAIFLISLAKPLLNYMGVKPVSTISFKGSFGIRNHLRNDSI